MIVICVLASLLVALLSIRSPLCAEPQAASQDFALTLTGDSIITQRLSLYQNDPTFMAVATAVRDGDAAFTNLEILFHNYESAPAAQSGGTWLRADPHLFKELEWLGFNLFATANNHSLDYGIGGLERHLRTLQDAGAAFAGTGMNLGEARAPAYLETRHGRVALVSCASTFSPSSPAGAQRPDLQGRPGLNPLRVRTRYRVDGAGFAAIRKIKEDLKLGGGGPLQQVEPDTAQRVTLLGNTFELGDTSGVMTEPDPRDLKGLTDAVRDARRMADFVVVSVHAHEGIPGAREVPAQFLVTFAHAAIAAGADVVVGHGPHVLRGVEIYNGRVIFYSLANFIFQADTTFRLPADLYEQYSLGPDALPGDLYETRSDHDRKGFAADPLYWESVIARVAFRDGKPAEVRLMPITLGYGRSRWQRGRPAAANAESAAKILARLEKLSQALGTTISVKNGQGLIRIEK